MGLFWELSLRSFSVMNACPFAIHSVRSCVEISSNIFGLVVYVNNSISVGFFVRRYVISE